MDRIVTCPDHPGLVNDPAHFLNFIDINCVPYTWPEIFLFAGGCLLWVVAYGIIIRNAFRDKFMELAALTVCSNFAWEFIWSFPFKTDVGWFLVWTYRAWFFLDILIVWLLIKYGPKQIVQPAFRKHFTPAVLLIILAFTVLYYFFAKQGMDTPIGSNSAYICQVILSASCLLLLLGRESAEGFSMAVAWLRTLGTAMNTVMMLSHFPDNRLLHSMGIMAFVMDMIYIATLARMRRRDALGGLAAAAGAAAAAGRTA